jgi:hypothetical protein
MVAKENVLSQELNLGRPARSQSRYSLSRFWLLNDKTKEKTCVTKQLT